MGGRLDRICRFGEVYDGIDSSAWEKKEQKGRDFCWRKHGRALDGGTKVGIFRTEELKKFNVEGTIHEERPKGKGTSDKKSPASWESDHNRIKSSKRKKEKVHLFDTKGSVG